MRYPAAIEYLLSFADLERAGGIGRAGHSFDLSRMRRLLELLGHPEAGRRTVHIAGSKGKSSTAIMVDAILRAHGLRTGRYTSPDLHSKRERVAVGGVPLTEEGFAALVEGLMPVAAALEAEGQRPTTFELMTALAFVAYREAAVDVQVLEVGLGGRLDATNVLDEKDVAIITPLELEHTDILGDDLRLIAAEKAAIARPGVPVVMALQPETAADAVRAACERIGAPLHEVALECAARRGQSGEQQQFRLRTSPPGGAANDYDITLPLAGAHQMENAIVAIRAAELFAERAGLALSPQAVRQALAEVRLPGRVEVVGRRPRVIFDAAHTPGSMRRLVQTLREDLGVRSAVVVIGVSSDKDPAALARILAPVASIVIATSAGTPRSLDPAVLAQAFAGEGCDVQSATSAEDAFDTARAIAGEAGVVVVTGSFFLVAELRAILLGLGLPVS